VLPHGRDQADTAARVTARGAGIALVRTASPAAISRAVRRVLQHDSYRIAARHLGQVIRRAAAGNTLTHELEDLAGTDRVPFQSTSARSLVSRVSVVAFGVLLVLASPVFALDRHKAAYVGGTLPQFQYASDHAEGRLDFGDSSHLLFTADRNPAEGRRVRIAYASIQDLEFSQHVSRRLVTTIAAAALGGPMGLLVRPASRRHYLTISFLDEQRRSQVVILELGKDIVRSTLRTLEACSAKPIEYRDEEARKWIRG
jgi:hypothetical protein